MESADGVVLRGWHLLPPGHIATLSAKLPSDSIERDHFFDSHLQNASVVVISFHGNAGNRGLPRRVSLLRRLSSQLGAHILTFDYRGFGDSGGWPSEEGTALDALAMWRWLQDRVSAGAGGAGGTRTTRIFLYGHSLGTAIATELAAAVSVPARGSSLQDAVGTIDGLILDSPFSSVADALKDFPYAAPLRLLPRALSAM